MKKLSMEWQALKKVVRNYHQLQRNVAKLPSRFAKATKTIHELQRATQRYQFKIQPSIKKIEQILAKSE
ncbi:hypothetical protein HMPREF0501_00570 [Limosilactobacillus coleohominis 101-4-CHN]|uniref:Uncharacterized protein n=1 Tax=Limosilactobacillus coleohominis 101-4-CHN TaxID=575594 RepID=C7XTJ2_9LACO|nr:hypothetical protein [Limosilactobacillus coleohominis]EEU31165.1 hypothetical protein HMPREF0501_00570 [Limosilactobacillus coleohominis 101-4-CHN]